jgi:hypothetical protein
MKTRSSSKSRVMFLLVVAAVFLFLFAFIGVSWSRVSAQAPTAIETISPYLSAIHMTDSSGKALTGYNINGPSTPPAGFQAEMAPVLVTPEGSKILTTPAFTWVFGCSSVSGAMIAGYYDWHSYPNMYTGPTNGGLMPLVDSSWAQWQDGQGTSYPNNPLVASHKGSDGRTTKGSIDDYWIKYGSNLPDPYIGHWTQHTWSSAIGDFMKTSQSKYGSTDGSTWFWNYNDSTKLTCAAMKTFDSGMGFGHISDFDGTYGRLLFYQARGYTVTDCYNQPTDNNAAGGFSMANFRAQINAGNPVFLNLAGHSIVGVGYASSTSNTIYIHNTWDTSTHTMTWGTSYSGMKLLSVSVVNLKPGTVPSQILPNGKTTASKPTFTWSKVASATKYQIKVYQGSTLKYAVTAPSSMCGSTTGFCSGTPSAALAAGTYKWEIQAFVGGAWKPFSTFMVFKK